MKKRKAYWEMNAEELAASTKSFDDPKYHPSAVKPSSSDRAQLLRWRKKRAAAMARLTLSLDKSLIEETDDYAVSHGVTFSDVVTDALRKLMKKSA